MIPGSGPAHPTATGVLKGPPASSKEGRPGGGAGGRPTLLRGVYESMRAIVNKKTVWIDIGNVTLRYNKNDQRVKVNYRVVLWYSPVLETYIPVPISQ